MVDEEVSKNYLERNIPNKEKQLTLSEAFSSSCSKLETEKYPKSHKKQKKCEDFLFQLISSTSMPYPIVELSEFKTFLNEMDPKFRVPL